MANTCKPWGKYRFLQTCHSLGLTVVGLAMDGAEEKAKEAKSGAGAGAGAESTTRAAEGGEAIGAGGAKGGGSAGGGAEGEGAEGGGAVHNCPASL